VQRFCVARGLHVATERIRRWREIGRGAATNRSTIRPLGSGVSLLHKRHCWSGAPGARCSPAGADLPRWPWWPRRVKDNRVDETGERGGLLGQPAGRVL
jgi:hypothetical protein